jgi:pimeloyl-ACP methyl ester carboxylesterase
VWRHWLEGLAVHHQLIRYDELGSGLSDWNANDFSLDAWLEDLDAVVSAAGLKRFPLLGLSRGAPTAIAYAACYPQRVSHLILCGGYVRGWQNRILARKRKKSWICFTSSFAWVGANPTQLLDRFSQACLYRMALQSR